METSYNPERDPTRTTPTPIDRCTVWVGEVVALAGFIILWVHTSSWIAFGVLLIVAGAGTVLETTAEINRKRHAGLEELKRRARARGILIDEEDDND